MAQEPLDLHALDPEAFREKVHSFEFWFEAVGGYLVGLEHGHRPQTPETELSAVERERLITTLCNTCVGETAALEGAGGLIQIAPNRATKVFLATQTVDEGRHLEVLTQRLRELGVAQPDAEIEARADPRTREVLAGIIKDERRHIGFGENELGRRLRELPVLRERLAVVREELDPLVLRSFEEAMDAIGTPSGERGELGRSYLAAVERLGFA